MGERQREIIGSVKEWRDRDRESRGRRKEATPT